MIPCVSLTETSVLGNMKERVKEMRVFGCRLNFWNNVTNFTNKGMYFSVSKRLNKNNCKMSKRQIINKNSVNSNLTVLSNGTFNYILVRWEKPQKRLFEFIQVDL
jgi:hypothetical protein